MSILSRIAFRLLRLEGYRLLDIQDSWSVILAEKQIADADSRSRILQDYLLHHTLSQLLRALQVSLVLDVGAFVGRFAMRVRKAGFRGKIVSFEPNPELHENLKSVSAGDPAWQIERCGVGAVSEARVFNVMQDRVFTSLRRPNEFAKSQFNTLALVDHEITAPICRLDEILRKLYGTEDVPDFCLKTDTQGNDLQVFESLGEYAKHCRIVLTEMPLQPIYENVPAFREMSAFFEQRGFAPVEYYPVSRARYVDDRM